MSQTALNYSRLHPYDEVPTPQKWFRGMEEKTRWKEREIFKGKTLLCPCDDYEWSGFAKYFIPRFDRLGIKKLVCRSYNPDNEGKLYVKTGGGETVGPTEGHGDFRDEECQRLKAEADIIITKPPYSQKKDYYLFSKLKPFITVLPTNILNGTPYFEDLKERKCVYSDAIVPHVVYLFGALTNLPGLIPLRQLPKPSRIRAAKEYERYDHYNAIHISRLKDIPPHSSELMGVPSTIFQYDYDDKYEVLDLLKAPTVNGKAKYSRVLIKEKTERL